MWDMNRARLTDTTKIVPQKIDNHKIFSLILFTRERERERERERSVHRKKKNRAILALKMHLFCSI
jgi:hypothetical protein